MKRALLVLLAGLCAGCARDFVGRPMRPGVDGFRAHAAVKKKGRVVEEFELAVRGNQRRKERDGAVVIWDGDAKKSWVLDASSKTAQPRRFTSLDEVLPGHPLTVGFSETEEAARRGIETYHREGDYVWAGHACWIWRFDDHPDADVTPSTTYWLAPDLDRLVLRVARDTPGVAEVD